MNYRNEKTTYKKKDGKIFEVIEREIDLDSLDEEILELQNQKTSKQERITELNTIKNT